MRVVRDDSTELAEVLAKARPASRSYVTIGVFDGVHRGHQQLIAGMVEAAHSTRSVAAALTFWRRRGAQEEEE